MAPIKFEENIKEKLEKRIINPSENAWSKLSNKLDEQKGESNSKIVWWIGIAASLVGVFLVTTLFFNNVEGESVLPTLVDSPIKDVVNPEKETLKNNVVVENEKSSQKEANKFIEEVNTNKVKKEVVRKTVAKRSDNIIDKTKVVANTNLEDSAVENENVIIQNSVLEEVNNQVIVAQILETENDKILVTDSEIESLLENAQKDIALNQIKTQKEKTVNANSLLEDVESDLDVSFRDKIFKTIESSYITVKTAVVERNY